MENSDRFGTMAGVVYALFFYIRFEYGLWDMSILWTGNIAAIIGFILIRRKRNKDVKKGTGEQDG